MRRAARPPLHLVPVVFSSPRRSDSTRGNANEFLKLLPASTQEVGGLGDGGLRCRVLSQSTTTSRPSKHSESSHSLTVPPPVSRSPPRLLFSAPLPGVVATVNQEARRRLPNTEEGSLLHASLTLFSLANFSFLHAPRLPPFKERHAHGRLPAPRLTILRVILTRRLSRRGCL